MIYKDDDTSPFNYYPRPKPKPVDASLRVLTAAHYLQNAELQFSALRQGWNNSHPGELYPQELTDLEARIATLITDCTTAAQGL